MPEYNYDLECSKALLDKLNCLQSEKDKVTLDLINSHMNNQHNIHEQMEEILNSQKEKLNELNRLQSETDKAALDLINIHMHNNRQFLDNLHDVQERNRIALSELLNTTATNHASHIHNGYNENWTIKRKQSAQLSIGVVQGNGLSKL